MKMTARWTWGACIVGVAACAEPRARSEVATSTPSPLLVPAPTDAGASDAACKRWEEIIQSMEGAPNPMYAIDFARNSDAFSDNAKIGIQKTASLPMLEGDRPKIRRFAVVGHADADEVAAQQLSERRATAVMRALVDRGVAADRMEAHGLGAAPVHGAPPGTNRLVTFVTLVDYRGGVRHWAAAGVFVECTDDHSAPECGPTPEYTPRCVER